MKLPNKENAYVPLPKLKDYMLSETHTIGKSKAKLLRSTGFNETNELLAKVHKKGKMSFRVKRGIF